MIREDTITVIQEFIKSKFAESRADGVVIGLSGGLDSAVVTKLCVISIGNDKVLTLNLGENHSEDAIRFAKTLNVECRTINISKFVELFKTTFNISDVKSLGNVKARIRMIILYYHANNENRIVMGTGNKSELLTGYFTKFGDGGADFFPIGDLYKTQVREVAKKLDIPEYILKKVPSPELWKNQTDESEFGISYERLDKILYGIELGFSDEKILKIVDTDVSEINRIRNVVRMSVHKRKLPLIPKLGIRTIGIDWRE
jgi:NAD+ synthase